MTPTQSVAGIDSFEIIFDLRIKERTKQWLFLYLTASLQLLEDPQSPKYDYFVCLRKFCSKNYRPPTITIFIIGFDNCYAFCDSLQFRSTDVEFQSHTFETTKGIGLYILGYFNDINIMLHSESNEIYISIWKHFWKLL